MKNTKVFKCKCVPAVLIQVYSTNPLNFMSNLNGWTLMLELNGEHKSPLDIKNELSLTDDQKLAIMSEANQILLNTGSLGHLEEII